MASSSSSYVPPRGWTYDVFLSFRGEDTRYNFVDNLKAALDRTGMTHVFKDEEMERGKEITTQLLTAIKESRCVVVVFSKRYAESSWCLTELSKIMEFHSQKGQLVIPVFYHVDPSDVRRQKRDFDTAFRQHERVFREEMDKVNEWRKALTAATNLALTVAGHLSGYHITETTSESAIIDKIVRDISANVQSLGKGKNLVGIESRIDELRSLLCIEATQEVRMVGICGMGGIGKTTIAQTLFRSISYKFDGSSFVKDVRENSSSRRDICELQQKILNDITHHEPRILCPEDGVEVMQTRFCNKKVLLVLDDVDDVKQLRLLPARHEYFGVGSRIIITTRNDHVLYDTDDVYKPPFLLKEQSVELFSWHAFRKNNPPKEYEDLSYRAVRQCGGLPKALEVLGSFFRGREADVWESALSRLAKSLDKDIFEILNISYEGLEVSEQKIFLDIACFFTGKEKEHVTRVLDSFGFDAKIGIEILIEKSLINVSIIDELGMHDLVKEMGLKIVRERYPNSRLWQTEEILDVITKNRKLEEIEAIVTPYDDVYYQNDNFNYEEYMGFNADVFENMKNLRLLIISGRFTSCDPSIFPDELQWLRWNAYPFSSLRVANMSKLVGLEMHGGATIEHFIIEQKAMNNLKFIHLRFLHCLERFPDVSWAPSLERLILDECENLLEVHESLGSHKRLVCLQIIGCYRLKCLPSRIEMESLEGLLLSNCWRLEKLPEVSPCMIKLSHINLYGCKNLKKIPNSISELKSIKTLALENCHELQNLPEELGSMEKLQVLRLGCAGSDKMLKSMSESININFLTLTNLGCLRELDLSWRQIEVRDLVNNLDAFSFLEELYLSGNSKLTHLPATISGLSRLKNLEVSHCLQLQNLPELPSGIQVLKACSCEELEKIEDLTEKHAWLYKIWLPGCKELLKNQEYENLLNKMLQESFLKKCAAVDRRLSIRIPGYKIPSWFKEQQDGDQITLKLPTKCHTTIMGFAACGVYSGEWDTDYEFFINISYKDTGMDVLEVDRNKGFVPTEGWYIWMVYIPLSLVQQKLKYDGFQHWSLSVEGNLLIEIQSAVRCGAYIVYKDDTEWNQQTGTCISHHPNLNWVALFGNTFVYLD